MLCWFSPLEVMFGTSLSPSMYIYQLSPCYVRMYGCSFFPPFFSYKIPTIHLVFVITHKYSLMNCAEKRFCESKAVSLLCRPVLFCAIISFLAPAL